jgi:hypothetical protein
MRALDGDTYDLPAIIMTAELCQTFHGLPLPEYGHRVKFGNDPKKHIDFSAVTHVEKGKGIPPFLILYITENPNTTAQARRWVLYLTKPKFPPGYSAQERQPTTCSTITWACPKTQLPKSFSSSLIH